MSIPISERSIPAATIAFSPASAAAVSNRISSGHQRRSVIPAISSSRPGRTLQRSKTSASCSSIQAEVTTSGASTASTETTPTLR